MRSCSHARMFCRIQFPFRESFQDRHANGMFEIGTIRYSTVRFHSVPSPKTALLNGQRNGQRTVCSSTSCSVGTNEQMNNHNAHEALKPERCLFRFPSVVISTSVARKATTRQNQHWQSPEHPPMMTLRMIMMTMTMSLGLGLVGAVEKNLHKSELHPSNQETISRLTVSSTITMPSFWNGNHCSSVWGCLYNTTASP